MPVQNATPAPTTMPPAPGASPVAPQAFAALLSTLLPGVTSKINTMEKQKTSIDPTDPRPAKTRLATKGQDTLPQPAIQAPVAPSDPTQALPALAIFPDLPPPEPDKVPPDADAAPIATAAPSEPAAAPRVLATLDPPSRSPSPVHATQTEPPTPPPAAARPPTPLPTVPPNHGMPPDGAAPPPHAAPALDKSPAPDTPPPPAEQLTPVLVAIARSPPGSSHITLQLRPESLGTLHIVVERTPDAPTQIRIEAQRPETLALLQRDAPQLRHALDQAGVAREAMTVTVQAPRVTPAAAAQDSGQTSQQFVSTGQPHQGFAEGRPRPPPPHPRGDFAPADDDPPPDRTDLQSGIDITA